MFYNSITLFEENSTKKITGYFLQYKGFLIKKYVDKEMQ